MFGSERIYSAPSIDVQNIVSEGFLCTSSDLSIKDWEREDDVLEF